MFPEAPGADTQHPDPLLQARAHGLGRGPTHHSSSKHAGHTAGFLVLSRLYPVARGSGKSEGSPSICFLRDQKRTWVMVWEDVVTMGRRAQTRGLQYNQQMSG